MTAYYVANPAADGIPANVTLVALAENGAPPQRVPATQPLLPEPALSGDCGAIQHTVHPHAPVAAELNHDQPDGPRQASGLL